MDDNQQNNEFTMNPEQCENVNASRKHKGVKRGQQSFITARIVAALDKAKVSDGDAIHILIAVAESFAKLYDFNLNDLIINRTSLRSLRSKNRAAEAEAIRIEFLGSVI